MSFPAAMPGDDGPVSGDLQFEHAEHAAPLGTGPHCAACKLPVGQSYYHAQGQVVCDACAQRIQAGQQAPPVASLGKAALYGSGAALAGCILYALVSIITGWEIGLVAIVVGVMVGKAVRHGSRGLGGRPQQILAVLLTYFAITTSYIPVLIYTVVKHPEEVQGSQPLPRPAATRSPSGESAPVATAHQPAASVGSALLLLLLLTAAAPFLSLTSGISGVITLFIIFIGLKQAWRLTARSEVPVMGPYEVEPIA